MSKTKQSSSLVGGPERTFQFHIHEHTPYWESGDVVVRAKTKKEAIQKALEGDYEHSGNNEINLDTMGSSVAREVYAEPGGKVLGSKVHGVILDQKQVNALKLLLRCADSDLDGLLRETFSDPKHPANTTRKEIKSFFKSILKENINH